MTSYRLVASLLFCAFTQLLTTSCAEQMLKAEPLYPWVGPTAEQLPSLGNPYKNGAEWMKKLDAVYCSPKACDQWIKPGPNGLTVDKTVIPWNSKAPATAKGWRKASELPPITNPAKPLAGVRIGIDPGHIGGSWAQLEERDNLVAGQYQVREGDCTLIVAKLLAKQLRDLGAEVMLTREKCKPVTDSTPSIVAAQLAYQRNCPVTDALQAEANHWFNRRVEISARAAKLKPFKPDLTVCIHFDAGSPYLPVDYLHLIVNGCYTSSELEDAELRACMVSKALTDVYSTEVALASAVAKSMKNTLLLPPFTYGEKSDRVGSVPGEPYLWRRNLLANGLYPGPVIYTEPFAMLNPVTAARMVEGDYDGIKEFGGKPYKSIYREYASSVAEGIKNHFTANRKKR